MAEETEAKPAVEPAPPQPAPKAEAPRIAPKRKGFDPLRPVRYAQGFIGGTLVHGFDGVASLGRMGAFAGLGVGLLMCVAGGFSVGLLLMTAAVGLGVGGAVGGLIGFATGGVRGTSREMRREKYADELAVRNDGRSNRPSRGTAPQYTYRDAMEQRQQVSNYNFERTQQLNRVYERDHTFGGEPHRSADHWQDYVSNRDAATLQRGGR